MESQAANQLPEANSLPDGFVDSSTEDMAPLTPNLEQEKSVGDYKEDDFADLDDSSESRHEFGSKGFQTSEGRTEKTQKLRTFPVPLSERDNFDASVDLEEVPSKGSVEQAEGAVIMPNSAAAVSEASAGVFGCSEVKGQVQEENQNTETSIEGESDAQGATKKDVSVSESDDPLKNRKPENTETKRKSAKRTFKSEKEFLEFTLKYQQVLAERDAAMAVRDILESLCRELQRQNKMLMGECKRVSTKGQNLRLDLSAKFQDAIKAFTEPAYGSDASALNTTATKASDTELCCICFE